MFIIKVGIEQFYGPFKTANDAVKFAKKEFYSFAVWSIIPLKKGN